MTKVSSKVAPKVRPYWHVDAKWITGLLLGAAIITFLWIDLATRLTSREVAMPVTTAIVALQFSPDGLDDETDIERVRSEWLASGQAEFRPIEGMPVVLSREQVATLSARDLRLALARQIAEPLYDDGIEGFAASITGDPDKQEKFSNDAKLLGIVSQKSHSNLEGLRWLALVIVLVLAIPVVYFSAGLGRLITPGVVLILASWFGALIFGLSSIAKASVRPEPAKADGMAGMVWQEANVHLPTVTMGWVVAFGLGIGLLLAGVAGLLVRRFIPKSSH